MNKAVFIVALAVSIIGAIISLSEHLWYPLAIFCLAILFFACVLKWEGREL